MKGKDVRHKDRMNIRGGKKLKKKIRTLKKVKGNMQVDEMPFIHNRLFLSFL